MTVYRPPSHSQRSTAVSQSADQENGVLGFLNGTAADIHGRKFDDVIAFSDEQIEHTHNFIQWLFPLSEPSLSVPGSPCLSDADVTAIRNSRAAIENLIKAADWFFDFLVRNQHWVKNYDHNHLRITRVIKSLRLLVGDENAHQFQEEVTKVVGDRISTIDPKARQFWKMA